MSYVFRTYGCGACEESGRPATFELMQERSEPPPRFCPRCGEDFGEAELEPIPAKIAIGGSPIRQAVDGTYKWIEESSAARAEELNAPHLKVTNLHDNPREGDVAAIETPVSGEMRWYRDAMRNAYGVGYGWQGGIGGVANAATGSASSNMDPNVPVTDRPGSLSLSAVQGQAGRTHAARRAEIEQIGRQVKPR